jgi:hypothetical protein
LKPEVPEDVARASQAELWRRGDVAWLLDEGQAQWVTDFWAGDGAAVWMIGRQRGKSFAALSLACGLAVEKPGAIIRYAALTAKSAKGIVLPTLQQVLKHCPPEVKPEVRELEGVVAWPNGSVLTWAGTDNEQFERLRGPRAHLVLLDESAFYADLERVESALLPQLTTTQGRALYLSTPPESVAHTFVRRWNAARAAGRGFHASVHDNPRLGPEGVARLERQEAARLGLTVEELRASTFWRREYLAELVQEESRAAVPGWTATAQAECVGEVPRPAHFDGYVGVDFGFGDPHGVVFAWWDYQGNRLVVEDELELRGATTAQLAEAIKRREAQLWGVDRWAGTLLGAKAADMPAWMLAAARSANDVPRQPYLRVGDNDPLTLADLHGQHGLAVLPTRKDDKALAVSDLDEAVRQRRIRVHPRCRRLIEQLASTTWNKTRTEWQRTDKDHGDLLDALVYLHRNVHRHRDPRPELEQRRALAGGNTDNLWVPEAPDPMDTLKALGGLRRR